MEAFASADGNGKNLSVPTAILELENALKKEWHDADEAREAKLEALRAAYKEPIQQSLVEKAGLYEGYGSYEDSDDPMEGESHLRMKKTAGKHSRLHTNSANHLPVRCLRIGRRPRAYRGKY